MTHADIASAKIAGIPDTKIFARASADALLYHDFTLLERMLPGVRFRIEHTSAAGSLLMGECADGSTVVWQIGKS